MNKTELVAAMAKETNLSKKDVEAVLKSFIDVVSEELKKGEKSSVSWLWYIRSQRESCQRGKKSSDW